jgi:hypothetical protein
MTPHGRTASELKEEELMKKATLVLAAAFALMAAPAVAQKVAVDWDEDFDRTTVETYAWVAPEQLPASPLMQQRILNALDYELSMIGRVKVEADKNPDVFVTVNGTTDEEMVVHSDHFGYGYGGGWRGRGRGGLGGGTTTSRSSSYTKGTLVVDIWDAESKNLVFRGTITDTLSDKPEKNEKKVNKGMSKLFKEFDKKYEKAQKKKQ